MIDICLKEIHKIRQNNEIEKQKSAKIGQTTKVVTIGDKPIDLVTFCGIIGIAF